MGRNQGYSEFASRQEQEDGQERSKQGAGQSFNHNLEQHGHLLILTIPRKLFRVKNRARYYLTLAVAPRYISGCPA